LITELQYETKNHKEKKKKKKRRRYRKATTMNKKTFETEDCVGFQSGA
jgi:hypothetical protein